MIEPALKPNRSRPGFIACLGTAVGAGSSGWTTPENHAEVNANAMNRKPAVPSQTLVWLLVLVLACGAVPLAAASLPERWISLFNGKTLAGWKELGGRAKFEVRDGAIVGTVTAGVNYNSFLVTDDASFDDFIFECEFKCDPDINSGVQFRSRGPDDKNYWVHGYQYEIDPTARALTGGIQEEGGRAWLAPTANQGKPQQAWLKAHGDLVKVGEWNNLRIEARGTHLRTWLNEHLMADIEDRAPVRIARGFFGLQVHHEHSSRLVGREVAFRNLRVLRLD